MTERQWYSGIGQHVRLERKRRGWTIYDVAALVGRSGMWVSSIERGLIRMKAYDYYRLRQEGLL